MGKTSISWTNVTWNPVKGCDRISPGCLHCYAESIAARFSGPGKPFEGFAILNNGHAHWTGKVELVEKHLYDPLHWRKPRMVFVNSMSDIHHTDLSFQEMHLVFRSMATAPRHIYQTLTKRANVMKGFYEWSNKNHLVLPPHLWTGVSVEDRKYGLPRIDLLRQTPVKMRWLSIEPLLEHLGKIDLTGLDWVVIGGESGPNARKFEFDWARSVISQCKAHRIPVFMKQIGSNAWDGSRWHWLRKRSKGEDMSEWPKDLRVREYPAGTSEILEG